MTIRYDVQITEKAAEGRNGLWKGSKRDFKHIQYSEASSITCNLMHS